MKNVPVPENESLRIAALRRNDLLDTLPQQEFDDLTRFASLICSTPIALMSLLDGDRQWFKSRVGLSAEETARNISFCGHAIESNDLFEVTNALDDVRFFDNPMVVGAPDIRFYAGAPLISSDGYRLGTLCVIDRVPRQLTPDQRDALMALGRQASRQIEYRATMRELAEHSEQLKSQQASLLAINDSCPVGMVRTDRRSACTYVNRKFLAITGLTFDQAMGAGWVASLHPEDHDNVLARVAASDQHNSAHGGSLRFVRADGSVVLCRAMREPILVDGVFEGFITTVDDVTERNRMHDALWESEARLRLITDNMPALISFIDTDKRYRFANKAYQQLLGIDPQTMLGRTVEEMYGAARYALIAPEIEAASNGYRVSFERIAGTLAKPLHLQCEYLPAFDQDRRPIGFYVMAVDVTSRRIAEKKLRESEGRLSAITNHIPALVAHIDSEQRYLFVNTQIGKAFNKKIETMIGRTMQQEHTPALYATLRPFVERVLDGELVTFEGKTSLNGQLAYYQSTYVPDHDASKQVRGFYAMTFDVTESKNNELRQHAAEMRLRAITDNLPVLITYIDYEGRLQFANATIESWMGIAPESVHQRMFEEVVGVAIYAERKTYMERALAGERVEFEMRSSFAGTDRYLQSIYIPDRAPDGFVRGFYTVTSDISQLKSSEEKLAQLARFDTLTALPNRYQLNEKLVEAVARSRRLKSKVAVLYLDIDHFKQINDTYGHAAGDAVLVELARRLSACVRSTDTVARLSGDEFVIVLEGLQSASEPGLIAQKIVASMATPWLLNTGSIGVSCSIGIAFAHTSNLSADDLLGLADKSLYQAKRAGRNTFMLNDHDLGSAATS